MRTDKRRDHLIDDLRDRVSRLEKLLEHLYGKTVFDQENRRVD